MGIKTIIKVAKLGVTVALVGPQVIEGSKILVNMTKNLVNNKVKKSEKIKEIKKNFKLRREGVKTVKFKVIK